MSEAARTFFFTDGLSCVLDIIFDKKKTAQVQRNHRPSTVTNFQTSKST